MAAAFEPHAIRLHLGPAAPTRIGLVFEGASNGVTIGGEGKRAGLYNFFIGNDRSTWRSRVPSYSSVLYRGMYDGIDLRVRDHRGRFEYDLMVSPGADLATVVVRAGGATRIELAPDGALLMHTAAGVLRQTPPETTELLPGGGSRPIESRFRLIDEHRYGFEAPARDEALPLVVDPALVWSTFTGGTGGEQLGGIELARDGSGDIFLSGYTTSDDFSATPMTGQTATQKSFVARIAADGSALVYLTLFAGIAGQTYGGAMVTDAAGRVIVVGTTTDLDFPTTPGVYQPNIANTNSGGLSEGDGFVTRFLADGTIDFSTYLGGSDNDGAGDVAFDPSGSLIVTGTTRSADFPVTVGAFDTSYNAPPPGDNTAFGEDVFITRMSPDGSSVTYSTFFGGQTYETVSDVVVDPQGFVTVAGFTTSSATGRDIPITPGALDSTWNGSEDGYVARFKLDGNGAADLKYSTFLGGVNWDRLEALAFDPADPQRVIVAGWSWVNMISGTKVPTTAGSVKPVLTPNPPATELFPEVKSGFATQFRFPATGGGSMVWSTFAGGNFDDMLNDVVVDDAGNVIVLGGTRSYDLQTTRGAFDRTYSGATAGAYECFLWRISPNGAQLDYSTFFGGRGEECEFYNQGRLAYFGGNTVAIAGITNSVDLPTTPGTIRTEIDEVTNASNLFVSKLTLAADASGDLSVDPPTLLSPANGTQTDYGSVTRFKWSEVADPSGVEAYVIEVSSKPDFPVNFTQYRFSGPDAGVNFQALASITWHWRVRTADRAGNLSAWSATSTFTTGVADALPSISMVQVYPERVAGGASSFAVLHLTDPAPPDGAVVTLSAHDGRGFIRTTVPVSLPETVNVPAGALVASFPIATAPVAVSTPVHIYATIAGIGAKGTISVDPTPGVKPASLSLNPLTVAGGTPAVGSVTLTGPAPTGGKVVQLDSSHPAYARVPASITIPAGATSGSFQITTSAVPFGLDVTIEAVGLPAARLSLKPPGVRMTGLSLNASTVTGGATVTGTITFSGPIPVTPFPSTTGAIVKLWSTSPAIGLSPLVVVPVGASSLTFGMNVQNVPETTSLNIMASYDNATLSAPLTITGSSASLASLTLNVSTVTAGHGGVGFVNLTGPAPAGHMLVTLTGNHPAINLPPNVSIPAGSTQGLFAFTTSSEVTATTAATITARFGSSTATAGFTINPPVRVYVTGLTLSPASVAAGGSSTATVALSGPVPTGGATIQMSSAGPATVPSSMTVPAGASTATFNVATTSVSSTTEARVWALLNTTWATVLTVTPGTAQPTLSAISLSPASVAGGTSSQGTVTLTGPAPSGGAVVALSSSNTSAATVPASVTVAAGTTSRTFSVSTQAASSSTSSTISGTFGATRTAVLNVMAAPSQTPAAPTLVSPATASTVSLPVVLDWNDVTAAASYQIQIDDSSTFSAPRVVDQTLTVSQFSASSLAARQHWWRVRGRNSAGTAGAWSAVRTFTPQATSPPPPPGGTATLSVTATGRSGERVTSSPTGINVAVGSSGSASFASGTRVTLTISNGRDAIWSGACSSGGSKAKTCAFTINGNASVTANVQ